MKYVVYIIAIIAALASLFYLNTSKENINTEITYQNIKPEDAKKMLDKDENVILLDVRTLPEYEDKHIPNSVLLPLNELESKAESVIEDKETYLLVYCRSGNRSVTASNILVELGYKNVFNLGGIIDWPYETKGK